MHNDAGSANKDKGLSPKLLFFVSEDWYFCSHRLPLAQEAVARGYRVTVVTRVARHGEEIRNAGIRLVSLPLKRSGLNPILDLVLLWRLYRIYLKERPDIVHHVALKPILYGSMAAALAGVPRVVNAFAGLGHLFISSSPVYKVIKTFLLGVMRLLFYRQQTRIIFQNEDDRDLFIQQGVVTISQTALIRGSGVDVDHFCPAKEALRQQPLVVLIARMLRTKGVEDFVQAARILKKKGRNMRMVLVGDPDPDNPASIPPHTLDAWNAEGCVEYWGARMDISSIYQRSTLAVLPSYREGLPKSLIEAAACGVPLVAYDVPGCREVVHNGKNGILVRPGDSAALADAIECLLDDDNYRQACGEYARNLAEKVFALEEVKKATFLLYDNLIQNSR